MVRVVIGSGIMGFPPKKSGSPVTAGRRYAIIIGEPVDKYK
jgi:hypothetical protein